MGKTGGGGATRGEILGGAGGDDSNIELGKPPSTYYSTYHEGKTRDDIEVFLVAREAWMNGGL